MAQEVFDAGGGEPRVEDVIDPPALAVGSMTMGGRVFRGS